VHYESTQHQLESFCEEGKPFNEGSLIDLILGLEGTATADFYIIC